MPKVHIQMGLDKYIKLNLMEQQRVLSKVDADAKDKGYLHQQDLKEKRVYIWEQMISSTTMQMFPR